MNDLPALSSSERAASATLKHIRVLQIIYLALGGGMIMLGAILLLLSVEREGGSSAVGLLSAVHGMVAVSAFSVGILLFQVQLRGLGTPKTPDASMQALTAAYVMRAALFEGPAMFGIIVLFIAGPQSLSAQPAYWANLASPIIFLLLLAATFPTEDRIRDLLRRRPHAPHRP